jgi:hypothetical protein
MLIACDQSLLIPTLSREPRRVLVIMTPRHVFLGCESVRSHLTRLFCYTVPVEDQESHLRIAPDLSSRFHSNNFSAATVQSYLFTHSWNRLGSLPFPTYAPTLNPISLLKWCKGRNGLRHEFLLLKVDGPENGGPLWLRLERRVHESATTANCIISSVLSGNTEYLCPYKDNLLKYSPYQPRVDDDR